MCACTYGCLSAVHLSRLFFDLTWNGGGGSKKKEREERGKYDGETTARGETKSQLGNE